MNLIDVFPCPNANPDNFGWDGNPYDDATYNPDDAHNGHDIFGKNGDPIVRAVSGTIDPYRYGWDEIGGWRFWILGDNRYRYYHAHCQEGTLPVPGSWGPAGELAARMDQSGEARWTSPHLHLGMKDPEGNWIPDFYSELIAAFQRPKTETEVEDMLEKAEAIGDGWYLAGWFTKSDPWKCDVLITAKTALTDVEVYFGDKRQGVYNLGKFNASQSKVVPRANIPGDGTIWLRPIGGEILRATVRTYK